ncbi:MAG: O-methyltransferase [Euzebyales bacterium]|nr:O-methyltransferase [Euzebyales bacterium]
MEIDEKLAGYVRRFNEPEDEPLRAARARSEEADIAAVQPDTGALLRFFARLIRARHVVEVGSGGGYSGLWLLGGMEARGSLTTIEIDPANQSLAQRAYGEARLGDRVRSMLGPALDVLPRLADANYDMVFLDAAKSQYVDYLFHAKRLLRPGGLLLADNVLWSGRVADATVADDDTDGLRDFNDAVREDRTLHGTLLPVGDGVLAAVSVPQGS